MSRKAVKNYGSVFLFVSVSALLQCGRKLESSKHVSSASCLIVPIFMRNTAVQFFLRRDSEQVYLKGRADGVQQNVFVWDFV